MKIIASLIILGLCASVCYSDVTTTSQASAMSTSWLNNTATKVYSAANETDAAIWNQNAQASPPSPATGVGESDVIFGPGTSNDTAYVYGILTDSSKLSKIYKRTLNATIVSWGNDTNMASVVKDDTISSTTPASSFVKAVGPGYLAILSTGTDGTNKQVYLNLVSGTTASEIKLTTVSDTTDACAADVTTPVTATSFTLGNIWYDIEADAFFYTYSKKVDSTPCEEEGEQGTQATTYTIYLGGHYVNGTAYWEAPGLSLAPTTDANEPKYVIGGGDNWLNAANIYVVYKDEAASPPVTYFSKASKNTTTTSAETFSSLVSDDATADATKVYKPLSVWASGNTFGIAVACANQTDASTYNYPIWNFFNGTATATDSGLSYTDLTTGGGAESLSGWMLTTGYTLVGGWKSSTADAEAYQIGTFFANGTANQTASTLATVRGPVSFYSDVNGTIWVGWTDVDTDNDLTYAGYLAILQGQINEAGANNLSTVLAFIALFLVSIFAF